MNTFGYIVITTVSLAAILFVTQLIWVALKLLDLRTFKEPPLTSRDIRRDQKSFVYNFLIVGIATIAASYGVGISASWTFEQIRAGSTAVTLPSTTLIDGPSLFFITIILFAAIISFVFWRYFRQYPLTASELLADIKNLEKVFSGIQRDSETKELKEEWNKSRLIYRKSWRKAKLDVTFYRLFMHKAFTIKSLNRESIGFLVRWQYGKWPRIIYAALSSLLAVGLTLLGVIIAIILLANNGTILQSALSVLIGIGAASVLVVLQFIASILQLKFLSKIHKTQLRMFTESRVRIDNVLRDIILQRNRSANPGHAAKLQVSFGPFNLFSIRLQKSASNSDGVESFQQGGRADPVA